MNGLHIRWGVRPVFFITGIFASDEKTITKKNFHEEKLSFKEKLSFHIEYF